MKKVDPMEIDEMPTFLNELALTFPEDDERRDKLVQCSMGIAVLQKSLKVSNDRLDKINKITKEIIDAMKSKR